MARKARVALIRAIEKKRQSKVLTYVTSDRHGLNSVISGDIISVIEPHLRALCGPKTKKFDLFLYSRGGDSNVPWTLVSMIREFLGERLFAVLVPFRAHSAATVVALGADEIVMTRMGELGPIDATIERGPHNPREPDTKQMLPISVEDVRGFFNLLEELGLNDPTHKMEAFSQLAKEVHPLALGNVSRILSQTQQVTEQLLKFRKNPLSESENKEIVEQLASGITSHGHTIHQTEAVELGLGYVKSAEDEGIEDGLWALHEAYADFFQLNTPFLPDDELITNDLDEMSWKGLPIACIESTYRKNVFTLDISNRRVRDVPPQVAITLPGLQVAMPAIPADAAQHQKFLNEVVTPIVQAQIETATRKAMEVFLRALPTKGFERVQTNSGWRVDRSPE